MPKGSTADNSAGWAAALGTNQECTPLQPSYVPSDARGLQALGDLPAQLAVKHREVVPVFDEYGEPHPMHGTYDVHFQRGPVTIPSTTERLQPGAVITPSRESLQPQTTCNSPPSLQLGRDAQAHPRVAVHPLRKATRGDESGEGRRQGSVADAPLFEANLLQQSATHPDSMLDLSLLVCLEYPSTECKQEVVPNTWDSLLDDHRGHVGTQQATSDLEQPQHFNHDCHHHNLQPQQQQQQQQQQQPFSDYSKTAHAVKKEQGQGGSLQPPLMWLEVQQTQVSPLPPRMQQQQHQPLHGVQANTEKQKLVGSAERWLDSSLSLHKPKQEQAVATNQSCTAPPRQQPSHNTDLQTAAPMENVLFWRKKK